MDWLDRSKVSPGFEPCLKKQTHTPMMQQKRIDIVMEKYIAVGTSVGLSVDFLRAFVDLLIQESCRIEDEIIHGDE